MRWCFSLLAMLLLVPRVRAQEAVRLDSPTSHRDTLRLDAVQPFTLRPLIRRETFVLTAEGVRLDSTLYRLDAAAGRLWLLRVPPPAPFLVAAYQTWPFDLPTVYRARGVTEVREADSLGRRTLVGVPTGAAPPPDPFGNTRLQRSGSITRGVLAGSNRDVNIESGLRLQLEGEVLDGVDLRAVLTDENTPILAEGTTQRLSEFDRVYIEITGKRAEARLGDVDLTLRGSELASITRKVQGAAALARVPAAGAFGGATVEVAGAAPRGQFRVQELRPIEGVQGPYRLEGAFGEPYILVIPGSEIVYLDGLRLVRDRNADYTIDYATGEITFTPRRLLTSEARITVEFQYATNQYPRTLVATHGAARFGQTAGGRPRALLGATFIREADAQTLSVDLDLTAEDSLQLAQSGDRAVVRSGAQRVTFDPEAPYVQYRAERREADSLFVALDRTPAEGEAVYRVRFSRVATGTGRYARGQRGVNGIAYVFVGTGGDYEPVRPLPKPREQALMGLQGRVRPLAGVEVYGEWARSVNDLNRLSTLDATDDVGSAYVAGLRLDQTPLGRLGEIEAQVSRRHRTAPFVSFDRTRPIDFARTWNLTDAFGSAVASPDVAVREVVDEAGARLAFSPTSQVSAAYGRLERGAAFESRRVEWQLDVAEARGPSVFYGGNVARSTDGVAGIEGRWLRQRARIEQPLLHTKNLRPRVEVEHERRVQRLSVATGDSLASTSLAFVEVRPGVAWGGEKLEASLAYGVRREQDVLGGRLRPSAWARTLTGAFTYRPGTTFQASGSVGLRRKQFTDAFQAVVGRQDAETVALQFDTRYTPLRRGVDLTLGYEAQTQRTPRLQEVYVRINPELAEAQYVWQDANANGLLDLDEFVPETTPYEGAYAKTFVPSDTLVGVIGVQARARLNLDPARIWPQAEAAWQRWLAQASTRTTVDIQERSSSPDLTRIYLLDLSRYLDPQFTQNGRIRVGQDVFLFRGTTRYGLDLSVSTLRGRNQLAGETEARRLDTYRAEGRYRPVQALGLRGTVASERTRAESARYASRRFDITSREAELGATWSPQPTLSVGLSGLYGRKRDEQAGRAARLLRLPLDVRLSRANRLVFTATAERSQVRLEGDATGQAAYELTDGRGPGTSYLWNASLQYVLSRYLNLTVSYDGRAPSGAPTIHTGRMQISASF